MNEWEVRCMVRTAGTSRHEPNTKSISGWDCHLATHHMDVISGKGKEKETVLTTSHEDGYTITQEEIQRGREEEAAVVVQRAWRHYSTRKTRLNSDARWKDAFVNAKKQVGKQIVQAGVALNAEC
jgi:hypothetical protein